MLAVYGRSFLGLKILQSCHAASTHQYLFFNCWLELTRPQYFQAATASREWSTFLADLSCRIFISGSLSSNAHAAHDFRDSQHVSAPKRMENAREDKKSGQNKVHLAVCVASFWTNESLFQHTKLILIPVMRMFSYFSITSFLFSKNKWLYSHEWLKWMGVVIVN